LPYRILSPLFYGYRVPFFGFLRALPHMPRALRLRAERGGHRVDLRPFESVTPLRADPVAHA
jgi:hypothetical protein